MESTISVESGKREEAQAVVDAPKSAELAAAEITQIPSLDLGPKSQQDEDALAQAQGDSNLENEANGVSNIDNGKSVNDDKAELVDKLVGNNENVQEISGDDNDNIANDDDANQKSQDIKDISEISSNQSSESLSGTGAKGSDIGHAIDNAELNEFGQNDTNEKQAVENLISSNSIGSEKSEGHVIENVEGKGSIAPIVSNQNEHEENLVKDEIISKELLVQNMNESEDIVKSDLDTEKPNEDASLNERGSPEGESEDVKVSNAKNDSSSETSGAVVNDVTESDKNANEDKSNEPISEVNEAETIKDSETEATVSNSLDADENKQEEVKVPEWLDILGNGLLKKKVITPGKGHDTRPATGSEVTIKISGELQNGTKLEDEELTFMLDDREVIQAFDLAVALMELEEKALLSVDAKYAYGPFGNKDTTPKIPPNCNITYEIELVSVTEIEDKDKVAPKEKVKIGDRKRSRGNSLYSRGDFGAAIACYKRALKFLEGSSNKDVIEMRLKCQNNLSAAQLKVEAFDAALMSCNSVLQAQPENMKAVFRKGKCLEGLGESEEALKWMKKASMLDPTNKTLQNEIIRIGSYVKKNRQKESDMYRRMVDGLRDKDGGSEEDESSFSWKFLAGTLMVASIGIIAGFFVYKH